MLAENEREKVVKEIFKNKKNQKKTNKKIRTKKQIQEEKEDVKGSQKRLILDSDSDSSHDKESSNDVEQRSSEKKS